MKNPLEVLRRKEQELSRIQEEVAALRIAAHLLAEEDSDEDDDDSDSPRLVEMP
jgi:hypothetical protein